MSEFMGVLPREDLLLLSRSDARHHVIQSYIKVHDFLEIHSYVFPATELSSGMLPSTRQDRFSPIIEDLTRQSRAMDRFMSVVKDFEARQPILATGAQISLPGSTKRRAVSKYAKPSLSAIADDDRSITNGRRVQIHNHPVALPMPQVQFPEEDTISSYRRSIIVVVLTRPCYIMAFIYLVVILGSGALGVYYWVAKDRMGDGFTAASWFVAVATLVMTFPAALHYPRCRCWQSWSKGVYAQATTRTSV
ncbi:hypothetical protein F5Y18DRAFT_383070 [Xylariaceae sp. FL1019]|nr:hypothetical protein F5Y18DRAFT_383070 [Xylariaceae sp. FL1019]